MRQAEPLACLIASRNLGDIVMWSGLLQELVAAGYASRYIVWTRPKMACMFEDLPVVQIVCSAFPVGTGSRFGLTELKSLLKAAAAIRAMRPSVVIDFVGDIRERLLARLIGGRHLQIGWGRGHGHCRMIRNPFGPARPFVTVPASVPNIYDGYGLMMDALAPGCSPRAAGACQAGSFDGQTPIRRIGLHPFASQPSKLWPRQCWRELVQALAAQGFELSAFASPEERAELERIFLGLTERVVLLTTDIRQYCQDVAQLDLVIGLDSLSMHMAHRFGVPSITINSGNPPELYAVPSGQTLAASGGCPHYPCYNVAPCRGRSYENACVKAISPQAVLAAVESLQQAPRASRAG
jgi:heptosyltransferase-3